MISRNVISDIIFAIVFVALQIFLFNLIFIAGKYTPVIYTIPVLFYPFYRNRFIYLFMAFLLGLGIDAFMGTWGINAFSTTAITYFRAAVFRNSVDSTPTDAISFQSIATTQFLGFIFTSIFIHQLLVQSIEYFKFNFRYFDVLLSVLVTTCISFAFILLYAWVFKVKQKI